MGSKAARRLKPTFVPKTGEPTDQTEYDRAVFHPDWTLRKGWKMASVLASGSYEFMHKDGRKCTTEELEERRRTGVPVAKHYHERRWRGRVECNIPFCRK